MTGEHRSITDLREQIIALLKTSELTPGRPWRSKPSKIKLTPVPVEFKIASGA